MKRPYALTGRRRATQTNLLFGTFSHKSNALFIIRPYALTGRRKATQTNLLFGILGRQTVEHEAAEHGGQKDAQGARHTLNSGERAAMVRTGISNREIKFPPYSWQLQQANCRSTSSFLVLLFFCLQLTTRLIDSPFLCLLLLTFLDSLTHIWCV